MTIGMMIMTTSVGMAKGIKVPEPYHSEKIPVPSTQLKLAECKHDWQYTQDKDFDWFECSKCGKQRDKTYCP